MPPGHAINPRWSPGYRDCAACQAVHAFVAGADQVTVTDVADSATVNVDPESVHADDGEHATVIAGRCPDFNRGRLNATGPERTTGADHPATGPLAFRTGTAGDRSAGGGAAEGREGFGVGRSAEADGRAVGLAVGAGRADGLLEGGGDVLGDTVCVGLGSSGSGAELVADVGVAEGRGELVSWGVGLADEVGLAADAGAGPEEGVRRTARKPRTGIASAVPVRARIRPGRCTMPPTMAARPNSLAWVRYPHRHTVLNIATLRCAETGAGAQVSTSVPNPIASPS